MKKLYLLAAIMLMRSDNMSAMDTMAMVSAVAENPLLKQKQALEKFQCDLKIAVDECAQELRKYQNNEDAQEETTLSISQFDITKYITPDMPQELIEQLENDVSLMKSTYTSFINQYEDKENRSPFTPRLQYTAQDYLDTYNDSVAPSLEAAIKWLADSL